MSWAARRRFIILCIVGAIIIAFLATLSIATFYQSPSCSDDVQNQGETGIDCGGSCTYLCTAEMQSPTVLYTKALQNNAGRTDVIASVENKNANAAAKNVPYRITLFGAGQALIQEITGTLDLPPGATVPVFVPGIVSGKQAVVGAFLTIAASAPKWYTLETSARTVPLISNIRKSGIISAPRIEAILSNTTVVPQNNVQTIVIVHDKDGNVIAASRTVIPSIPAQGQATATFTWNSAFGNTPATIEVVPIILLP